MARIINELTGRVRGKVGNLVYRITNGNTSLSALPTSRKIDNSSGAVVRKNRFKLTVKFTKAINSLWSLKYFWKMHSDETIDIKKSAFVKIFKKNYPYTSTGVLSDSIYLVPFFGFEADATSVTVNDHDITSIFAALGTKTGIDTTVETRAKLCAVFYFNSPVDPALSPFYFLSLESDPISLSLTNPMTFNITLVDAESKLIAAYSDKKLFIAMVTLDAEGNPVHYSDTFIHS
ncbi:MAG: hypothetical protein NTY74_02760 [Ignavibacteriae bacterium]|nr:hypothetical protein [Ignavibacteriota bacterium]